MFYSNLATGYWYNALSPLILGNGMKIIVDAPVEVSVSVKHMSFV